ncbi:LysR family transcriptional regulator [Streptomyces blastmyceticus]|uniref:LysR family transcriptional regulator n=1 Tax=Streptomyces blastmyceticus TaxID=68180 RepID=A0ABN0WY16_9ACTN
MEPNHGAGNLSLRQLEYLVTVAREGRLTRAAEKLHVTEPTISQQLRALERTIGMPLLERHPDGVRPTGPGEAFLPYARSALRCANEAATAARAAAAGTCRTLRIGTVRAGLPGVLLPGVRQWVASRPGTSLTLRPFGDSRSLQESVAAGTVDLGVGPRPVGWTGSIHTVCTEEYVLVCADDDPLREGEAHLEDLADRHWIGYGGVGRSLGDVLADACGDRRFRPRVALEVAQAEAAVAPAAQGVGLALVPRDVLDAEQRRSAVPLVPRLLREITVYTAPHPPADAAACSEALAAGALPSHTSQRSGVPEAAGVDRGVEGRAPVGQRRNGSTATAVNSREI